MSHLTAYLHVCVATLEGQRGRLQEAERHCVIAESLLSVKPNAWVLGASLINRACIACFQCDFNLALQYNQAAIDLTKINGSVRNRLAAEVTSAHILMLSGRYVDAERMLDTALADPSINGMRAVSAADTLARMHLAVGDLNKCDEVLSRIDFSFDASGTSSIYVKRWAALTRAKLLLRRGDYKSAASWIKRVQEACSGTGDEAFEAASQLLLSESADRQNDVAECCSRLLAAHHAGIRRQTDFQGQLNHSLSRFVTSTSPELSDVLSRRANRIWSGQGIVSVKRELGDLPLRTVGTAKTSDSVDHARSVANSLAALFDLASEPRLAISELLNLLERLRCATDAQVVEFRANDTPKSGTGRQTFCIRMPSRESPGIALLCATPVDTPTTVVLADVIQMCRAAFELEVTRQRELNRGAVWPESGLDSIEDPLFIADGMKALVDTARRASAAAIPILITGETGTGKEVIARLIHTYSPRASKTFLPFNCSATPREMLDSQLFGHRRGSFTGASENFTGVIRAAAGGTLFLDEIGESTLDIQPKLLRFLESGEVHPIGETHPQRVDVRVVAATNADVDALVAQGRFREDLFYRLNIIRLQIPPLRERRVEIPAFANHYLQKHAKEYTKGDLRLSEETMEYLLLYRWPGNVRQLANEMRRVAALAEPNAVIMPEHLSADIAASRRTLPPSERALDANEMVVRVDQPLDAAVQHVERTLMLQSVMARAKSVDEAARLLGLSRKGLYLKRLRFGMAIDRPRDAEADVITDCD